MDVQLVAGEVRVSRVGLGWFELGPDPDEAPDVHRAAGVLSHALECGYTWVDTSESYLETRNESLLGAAMRWVGGDVVVSTKVAPRAGNTGGGTGFRPDQVHRACRNSLQRLNREFVDIYLLHWPDDTGVPLAETWGAMGELKDAGMVRAIGLSNYELADIERCHAQRPVDVVQTGLNLIDYLDDRALIARCGELGIPVTVFEPLASGILTGRTLDDVRAAWGPAWEGSGFFTRLLGPGKGERSIAVAEALAPIADRLGASVAQVAMAWVLAQPGVVAALAGSHEGRHVRENADAADVDVSAVLDEIEALIPLGPSFG